MNARMVTVQSLRTTSAGITADMRLFAAVFALLTAEAAGLAASVATGMAID